ncbi:GspE/PulE family protein [Romboutsia sp. CE17]|uniref:GspE/PulE family protein n=1 Tax=Romboutsia sp. CE17 TaxID=2724150 RepID=UPI001FABACFE|nr:GspE/PulE family protein [Romboutsia sp. CE17]
MNIILQKVNSKLIKENMDRYYSENIKSSDDYAKNLFEDILASAVRENASDIHIEPFKDYMVIRNRIDGELKEVSKFNIDLYPALASVIKLEAHMDITEKRLPQDGRVDLDINGSIIDVRVSTIPTIYKEKIVLRILNRNSFLKTTEELGFSKDAIKIIGNIINKKSGILLVTGPTGSGKTTTVYSILNELLNTSKNIMTIENPVEYKMDGINQIQVNSKIGLTFDKGLRAILRQDPDIIMVGEIRDIETAKIAVRAAITGHLVISTMHTNDSISSIARLIDMQIPTYLINSSLIGVISQRLVRKLCTKCSHDISIVDNDGNKVNTKVAIGCDECNNGYIGRVPIYEILEINDDIKLSISKMKDSKEIKEIAIKNGMITFEDTYKKLVEEKIITIEEVLISNYIES